MLVFSAKAASPFRTTLSEPRQLHGGVCSMTAKQILDAFSETLMQDERILSPRERELLTSLLQNPKTVSGNPETQSAVAAAIARSVGETVAQRAFALLGGSIVEQTLGSSTIPVSAGDTTTPTIVVSPVP